MPKPYVEDLSGEAQNLTSSVRETGRTLQYKIDENRVPAAEKLQNAAAALHQKADSLPGGEKVSGLVHSAADGMEATADYVREHEVQDMVADVKHFVRKYPGQSLLTAVAAGFLLGRTFRRRA